MLATVLIGAQTEVRNYGGDVTTRSTVLSANGRASALPRMICTDPAVLDIAPVPPFLIASEYDDI